MHNDFKTIPKLMLASTKKIFCASIHKQIKFKKMKKFTITTFLVLLTIQLLTAQFNWHPTSGPFGVDVNGYIQNDHSVFVYGHAGLFRSTNGDSWEKILTGTLYYAPVIHGDSIIAKVFMTDPIGYTPNSESTLYLSQDNGDSWTTFSPSTEDSQPIAICSSGIYLRQYQDETFVKSEDLGQTWQIVNTPSTNNFLNFIGEQNNELGFGTQNQFWLSDQNGDNWASIPLPPSQNTSYNMLFSRDFIFIPTHSYSNDSAYITTDKGLHWDKRPLQIDGSASYSLFDSTIYSYDYGPGTTNSIFARSDDYGWTWQTIPVNQEVVVRGVGKINNKTFIQSYNTGIRELNEATGEIKTIFSDLKEGNVEQVEQYGDEIWVGNSDGLFKYNINTLVWDTVVTSIADNYFRFFAKNDNLVVAKYSDFYTENLWISQDNGQTWASKSIPVNSDLYEILEDAKIIDNTIFLFSSACNMYISNNAGSSWSTQLNDNWGGFYCPESKVVKFKNKFYANVKSNLLTSTNGTSWSIAANYPQGRVVDLLTTDDYLFMQLTKNTDDYDCYLYKSKDGITWQWANDGLPQAAHIANGYASYDGYNGGEIFKQNEATYFYNYFYGFYVSKDTCKTWYPIRRRLPNIAITDNKIFTGSYKGLYASNLPRFYGKLMQGTVFSDRNGNGVKEPNELPLPGLKAGLKSPSDFASYYFTTTKEDGSYVLGVTPSDTDTLFVDIQSDYIIQMQPLNYVTTDTNSVKNFAIQFEENITDLAISGGFNFPPRPGFDLNLSVFYKNKGTIPKGGKISISLDNKLNFLGAEPPALVSGDSLVWDIDELQPLESGNLLIHTNLASTAPLGEPVKFHGYFVPNNTFDYDPTNNYFEQIDTIVGSFDPNDKQVWPERGLTLDEITNNTELIYTIRFQNTGTFYAEKVRITDQLDTALNLTTFRLIGSSHEISELALRPGGLLEVSFDNIMLPDSSTNEPLSHGLISFAIQRKKDYINEYKPVPNTARIYFDFNEPIKTNTVFSPVAEPVEVLEILPSTNEYLLVAPNPAIDEFSVTTTSLSGKGTISLWDISGKLIKEIPVSKFTEPIIVSVKSLKPGAYVVLAQDKHHIVSSKLIVQNNK